MKRSKWCRTDTTERLTTGRWRRVFVNLSDAEHTPVGGVKWPPAIADANGQAPGRKPQWDVVFCWYRCGVNPPISCASVGPHMSDALQCQTCGEQYRVIRRQRRELYVACDCGRTSIKIGSAMPGRPA